MVRAWVVGEGLRPFNSLWVERGSVFFGGGRATALAIWLRSVRKGVFDWVRLGCVEPNNERKAYVRMVDVPLLVLPKNADTADTRELVPFSSVHVGPNGATTELGCNGYSRKHYKNQQRGVLTVPTFPGNSCPR